MQKITLLLSDVQTSQQQLLQAGALVGDEILTSSPKISKGENYKGLPWLVLDYPRYFTKENVLAIRTLFWWGNFFSITLHLSGNYKTKYEKKIIDSFRSLKEENFSVCINEDQWEHHFETTNYLPVHALTGSQFREIILKRPFIKLAKKIPLEQWNEVEKKLLEIFSQFINTLRD